MNNKNITIEIKKNNVTWYINKKGGYYFLTKYNNYATNHSDLFRSRNELFDYLKNSTIKKAISLIVDEEQHSSLIYSLDLFLAIDSNIIINRYKNCYYMTLYNRGFPSGTDKFITKNDIKRGLLEMFPGSVDFVNNLLNKIPNE